MQTSFASWLKKRYPGCHITFLVLKGSEPALEGHPHIDEVLAHEKANGLKDLAALWRLCRGELAKRKYHLAVDLHGTNRSFLVRSFLPETLSLYMDKRRMERFLLVKTKIDLLKGQPSLHERNLFDLAWAFGEQWNKDALIKFLERDFPGNKSLTTAAAGGLPPGLERGKRERVVLAPGASFAPKRWPVESFFALAEMILKNTDWECFVVGGPDDGFCKIFDPLERAWAGRFKNLQGKLRLADSLAVAGECSLAVGNDSLIGHAAEARSAPSFALFGPTSESFGFAPRLENSRAFSIKGLWCRPCSTTGSRACFRKRRYCMEDIAPEEIFEAAQDLLAPSAGAGHAF